MLAYIDSLAGMIPCKVKSWDLDKDGVTYLLVSVTTTRFAAHGYPRGAEYLMTGRIVVPRDAVYCSRQACGQFRVKPYDWKTLLPFHNVAKA